MECRLFLAAGAIALCAGSALAVETISIRPIADNTLYESATGSTSNGAGTAMFAGRNASPSNSIRRGLVLFDIAGSVPAGATILSAQLTLFNDAANVGPATVSLHRVFESWGEGTSVAGGPSGGGNGAPSTTGDATWIHRSFNSSLWTAAGGTFDASLSTTSLVEGPGSYAWLTTPQFVADVQSFLDSPSTNFGWLLRGNEAAPSTGKRFATREEPTIDRQPTLTITFIPAPGTGALLAFAGVVALRRRRG
jgi:hypothetical protein